MLECDCGNETMFVEHTQVKFEVDGEGNRETKIYEHSHYYCTVCGQEVCQAGD